MKRILCACVIILSTLAVVDVAVAKKGFSSSRSSFSAPRSSGSSNYSFKSTKTPTPAPVKRTTVAPTTSKPLAPTPVAKQTMAQQPVKYGANIKQQQLVANSKSSYAAQQSAFKPKPATVTKPTGYTAGGVLPTSKPAKLTVTPSISNKASSYDRTSYYSRRSAHYGNWNTPSYAYSGYSSYGMWDSLALWYMLDSINDRQYQQMYYNNMNNSDMKQWRAQADQLAVDNAELRKKLDALDASASTLAASNTPRDPNFIPSGIDADLLLSDDVRVTLRPKLRICAGPQDKSYTRVSNMIRHNTADVDIQVISTLGSGQNLSMMDANTCDAALVQRDSYLYHAVNNPTTKLDYTRIMSPYSEVVHLVCNATSGIDQLTDLTEKHTVAVGDSKSGSNTTWGNVILEQDNYADVKTTNLGDGDAVTALITGKVDCIFSVSGVNNKYMVDLVSNTKSFGIKLNLVEWDDESLYDAIDPSGQVVYNSYNLPSTTYAGLQVDNWLGMFDVDTQVATVPADLIVSNSWVNQNTDGYNYLIVGVAAATPMIKGYVNNN